MHTDILIVDDEKSFVRSLTFALEEAGFTTRSAHSGEAALAALADAQPGLMLLDLRLPKMSGTAARVSPWADTITTGSAG